MAKKEEKAVVEETTAASTENVEVQDIEVVEETVSNDSESNIFESKDGTKYELLVNKILFKGQRLEAADAVKNAKDVLESVLELNPRIFKKL